MFADLIRRLTAPAPDTLPDTDARLALGALLVRIARADGHYDTDEAAQINATLTSRYNLTSAEADALQKECEAFEAEAPDTVRFTRAIKDAVPYDDRLGVVTAMWQVVMADGVRDDEEDSLMRMVASLLGISDQDSHAARLRVSSQ